MSSSLKSFDAHIYFNLESRPQAEAMREAAILEFAKLPIAISPLVNRKVGPHPRPMFEIQFRPDLLSQMILWLTANRNGLPVLVHQVTGDDLRDHYEGALWMGEMLELDRSQLDPNPVP